MEKQDENSQVQNQESSTDYDTDNLRLMFTKRNLRVIKYRSWIVLFRSIHWISSSTIQHVDHLQINL